MQLIIILALLFSALPQQQQVNVSIDVVFVEPVGETFTEDEQAKALQDIISAGDYWHDLSPITTTVTIASSQLITTTDDVMSNPRMLETRVAFGSFTIIIIDNTESGRYLLDKWQGYAYSDLIYLLSSGNADTVAHEMGHSFYSLPHQYQEAYDIMGLIPSAAYDRHMIGCPSLAVLGRPCTTIALPMITR